MNARRHSRLFLAMLILTGALVTGCETGFVTDAARRSLSSFVIDLVTTAANETIAPDK